MTSPHLQNFLDTYRKKRIEEPAERMQEFMVRHEASEFQRWIKDTNKALNKANDVIFADDFKYKNLEQRNQIFTPIHNEIKGLLSNPAVRNFTSRTPEGQELFSIASDNFNLLKKRMTYEENIAENHYVSLEDMPWQYPALTKEEDIELKKREYGRDLEGEEINNYNFLFNTQGKEAAEDYRKSVRDAYFVQEGIKKAQSIPDDGAVGFLQRTGLAFASGLEQFNKGIESVVRDISGMDLAPTRPIEIASMITKQQLEADDKKFQKGLFDITESVGSLLPAVLVGQVAGAPLAGSILLGTSVAGNTYEGARKQGYSISQARTYALTMGTLQAGLRYAVGEISGLGAQVWSEALGTKVDMITNATDKWAAEMAIAGAGGATRAYVQTMLTPVIRNVILGENNEFKLVSEDLIRSALNGFLTTLAFETIPITHRAIVRERLGKDMIKNNRVNYMLTLGKIMDKRIFDPSMRDKVPRPMMNIANRIQSASIYLSNNPEKITPTTIGQISLDYSRFLQMGMNYAYPQTPSDTTSKQDPSHIEIEDFTSSLNEAIALYDGADAVDDFGAPAVITPEAPPSYAVIQETGMNVSAPATGMTVGEGFLKGVDVTYDVDTGNMLDIEGFVNLDGNIMIETKDGEFIPLDDFYTLSPDKMLLANYAQELSSYAPNTATMLLNGFDNNVEAYISDVQAIINSAINSTSLEQSIQSMDLTIVKELYDSVMTEIVNDNNQNKAADLFAIDYEVKPPLVEQVEVPKEPEPAKTESVIPKAKEAPKKEPTAKVKKNQKKEPAKDETPFIENKESSKDTTTSVEKVVEKKIEEKLPPKEAKVAKEAAQKFVKENAEAKKEIDEAVNSVKEYATTQPKPIGKSLYVEKTSERATREGGIKILVNKELSHNEETQLDILKAIGEKYGIEFVITDQDTFQSAARGNKRPAEHIEWSNIIVLDPELATEGVLLQYASMEAFYYLWEVHPEAAEAIQRKILERFKQKDPKKYEYALKRTQDDEQQVASAQLLEAFTDETFFEELVKDNPSLLIKITNAVAKIAEWFRSFFRTLRDASKKIRVGKQYAGEMQRWKETEKVETALYKTTNTKIPKFVHDIHQEYYSALAEAAGMPSDEMTLEELFSFTDAETIKQMDSIKAVRDEFSPTQVKVISATVDTDKPYVVAGSTPSELMTYYMPEDWEDQNFATFIQHLDTLSEDEKLKYTVNPYGEYSDQATYKNYITSAIKESEKRYEQDGGTHHTERQTGVVYHNESGESPTPYLDMAIPLLDAFGKAFGVKFVVTDMSINMGKAASYYFNGSNYILMQSDSKIPLIQIAGHELFHYLSSVNKDEARFLGNQVLDAIKKSGVYKDLYKEKLALYKDDIEKNIAKKKLVGTEAINYRNTYINEEIMADGFLGALENKGLVKRIVKMFSKETTYSISEALDSYITHLENATKEMKERSLYKTPYIEIMLDLKKLRHIQRNFVLELIKSRNLPLPAGAITETLISHSLKNGYIMELGSRQMRLDPDVTFDKDKVAELTNGMTEVLNQIKFYSPTHEQMKIFYEGVKDVIPTKMSRAEFKRQASGIMSHLENTKEEFPKRLMYELSEIVMNMLNSSNQVDREMYDYLKDGTDYLKETRIKFTEAQKVQISKDYGSFNDFRRSMFGSMLITNDGVPASDAWKELQRMYPEVTKQITAKSLPDKFKEFIEMSKPIVINIAEATGVSLKDLAFEHTAKMIAQYVEFAEAKTLDSEKAQLKKQVNKLYERIENMRERHKLQRQKDYEKYMEAKKASESKIRENYKKNIEYKKITDKYKKLFETLQNPTKTKHVPEILRAPVAEVLFAIDLVKERRNYSFTTKNQMYFSRALESLAKILERGTNNKGIDSLVIHPELLPAMRQLALDLAKMTSVADMGLEELKQVNRILNEVTGIVNTVNLTISGEHHARISELGKGFMGDKKGIEAKTPKMRIVSSLKNLVTYDSMNAYTFSHFLGKNGEKIFQSFFDGDKKRMEVIFEAADWFEENVKNLLTNDILNNKKVETFNVEGGELQLTQTQLMHLYILNLQEQFRGHYEGGIISDINHFGGEGSELRKPVVVTEEEVNTILESLDPKLKDIAHKLQRYNQEVLGGVGNETSMKIWGYEAFTLEDAWHIIVSKRHLPQQIETPEQAVLSAVHNQSFTKQRKEGANSPVVVTDIFDAFTDQVSQMAAYAGFSAPMIDAMNWYNYKDETGSVKITMETAMGKGANDFFIRLLKDINNERHYDSSVLLAKGLVANTKRASVGMNLRVAIQQPSAYPRAMVYISEGSLLKALTKKPNMKEVQKHSPIARWKSVGFLENQIGVTLKEVIIGHEGDTELERGVSKAKSAAVYLPQIADDITWAYIWEAAKLDIEKEDKFKKGSSEYYKAVTALFEKAIYNTQVVDTVFKRTQMMRSQDTLSQIVTAFMAENSQIYNMLLTASNMHQQAGSSKEKTSANRFMIGTIASILLHTILNAALASGVDALRDDEEGESLINKYVEAFNKNVISGLNPLDYFPYARDIQAIMEGFDAGRLDMQGVQYITYGLKEMAKTADPDKTTDWLKVFSHMSKGASYLTGVPFVSVQRDMGAVYKTIFGKPYSKLLQREKYARMYNFVQEGKAKEYDDYVKRLKSEGKTDQDIATGLAQVLYEKNIKVELMAEAKLSGDIKTYDKLYAEVARQYPHNSIIKAVDKHLKETEEPVSSRKLSEDGALSKYATVDLMKSIETLDNAKIEKIYDALVEHGYTEAGLKASITTYFKDRLNELNKQGKTKEVLAIRDYLVKRFKYRRSDIAQWIKED